MSNCYLFVLGKLLREGGYAIVRRSRYGWWPHVLWSADLITFEHYVPPAPYKRRCPPPLYRGIVKIVRAVKELP